MYYWKYDLIVDYGYVSFLVKKKSITFYVTGSNSKQVIIKEVIESVSVRLFIACSYIISIVRKIKLPCKGN